MNHRSLRRQRGIALITVLMVFAIAALLASKIITSKTLDTRRINGMINRTQAFYYARAAEELAILALKKDVEEDTDSNNPSPGDNLEEDWALGAIPFEIDNIGAVTVRIIDLNRYYNVNNLLESGGQYNEQEFERFSNLLEALDLDPELAKNLIDWLDTDNKEEGYNSESGFYENLQPGYLAANRRLTDVSELRMVTGFDAEVMKVLLPHITAIDFAGGVPINVNTASAYAMTSMQKTGSGGSGTKGLSVNEAQNILSDRPYENIADVNDRSGVSNLINSVQPNTASASSGYSIYGTTSSFWQINIRANYGGHVAYLTTVLYQPGGTSKDFIVLSRQETDNSHRFLQ